MAKSTTAFGLVFELKDKASRAIRALTSGIDTLSVTTDDAAEAAQKLSNSFAQGKLSGIRKAGGAIASLGKSMLSGVPTGGGVLGATKDLIESIPYLGKIVTGAVGFVGAMLKQIAELRGEQNRWQVSLSGLNVPITDLTTRVGNLSVYAGESQQNIMKLARSLGDVQTTLVDGKPELLEWTKNILELRNGFGLTEDDAASMTRTLSQMGVDGGLKKFGGEVLHLQKTLKLGDLLQDVPEVMGMVFRSSKLLGNDFRKSLGPMITNVALAADQLTKKFNMVPKAATKAAIGIMGQFQDMAFSLKATMLGVDEDFDPRFKTMLAMGEMVGKNFYQVSDAMKSAAETGKWDDLSSMFMKLKAQAEAGNKTAEHYIVKMQKELGLETMALLDTSEEAMALRKKLEDSKPLKPEDEWKASLKTVMDGADALEKRFEALTTKFVTSATANLPEMMKKLEGGMGLLTTAGNEATDTIGKFFAEFDKPMADAVDSIIENYVKPVINRTIAWFKDAVSGASIDFNLDRLLSDFKELSSVFGDVAAEFRRIGRNIRNVAHYLSFGKIESADEMDAKENDTLIAETKAELQMALVRQQLEAKAEKDRIDRDMEQYRVLRDQLPEEQRNALIKREASSYYDPKVKFPTIKEVRVMVEVQGKMPNLNGAMDLKGSKDAVGSPGGPVPAGVRR